MSQPLWIERGPPEPRPSREDGRWRWDVAGIAFAVIVLGGIPGIVDQAVPGFFPGAAVVALHLGGVLLGSVMLGLLVRRALRDSERAREAARLAERQASGMHERLVEAVEAMSEGFALWDPSDRLVMYNSRMREIYALSGHPIRTGLSFEQMIRHGAEAGQYAGVHPDSVENYVAWRMATHRNPSGPIEVELSDGRWLQVDERRTLSGHVVAIRTDITELKRKQAALTRQTGLLGATLTSMTQGLCLWDPDGRLAVANHRVAEMLELPVHLSIPGTLFEDLVRFLARRGDYGTVDVEAEVTRRVSDQGFPHCRRYERATPSGRVLEVISTPLPNGGRLVTYTDITAFRQVENELRDSEQRFRKLSDAALEGVIFHDKGVIIDANAAAADLFDYPLAELIGLAPGTLVAAESLEVMLRGTAAAEESRVEMWCQRRDGSRFLVQASMRSVPYRGRLAGVMSFRDVTEQRRTVDALRRAKEQAESASRAKSEFLAMISHEIRTPMNGVLGMIGLLLDSEMTAEQRTYAQTARESGEALLTILNDILDVSKMEAGKLTLESNDINLVGVVESVVELLAARATAKGIELVSLVPANVPTELRGDSGRLRQVLLNLAGNAVKFTEQGGVSVKVSLVGQDLASVVLRFEVADTGIGIATEHQARLFREFTQGDPGLSRRYGGTGLGLAISKRLVELMGGDIGFESMPGYGSRFWFTLALQRQAEARGPAPLPTPNGRRLLLLDPNPVSRKVLAEQLTSWGASVATFATGWALLDAAASAAFGGTPYHAALIDASGGGLPPRDIAQGLRSSGVSRLVLMTLIGHHTERPALEAMGFTGSILKPARQAQLLCALSDDQWEQEDAMPGTSAPRGEASGVFGHNRRILVVEDSITNQMVATALLKNAGFQVEVAGDGLEAIEAVRNVPYDLVLMDVAMPELDGFAATRTLRAMPPPISTIPIIAMTANVMEGDRERCLKAGMNDYVAKPIERAHLLSVVARWLPPGGQREPAPQPAPQLEAQPVPSARPASMLLDAEVLAQLATDLDAEVIPDLLDAFVREAEARATDIVKASAEGDLTALGRQAHTLKSSAGTFGASVLSERMRGLETAARNESLPEAQRLAEGILELVAATKAAYCEQGLLVDRLAAE
jgi:two-component system, sensor histidine kinase and response regulator